MKTNKILSKNVQELIDTLTPETEIYVVVRHISQSRTTRYIAYYAIIDCHLVDISTELAEITDIPYNYDWQALKVIGGGMDMAFYVMNCAHERFNNIPKHYTRTL